MPLNLEILNDLLDVNTLIQKEKDYMVVIDKLMEIASKACNSEGCFFYTLNNDYFFSLDYSFNKKLNIRKIGSENMSDFPTFNLNESRLKSKKSFVETCALNSELIIANNAYGEINYDNSFFEKFDEDNNYRTTSVLSVPIISRRSVVIGVAQFINPKDAKGKVISFTEEMQKNILAICSLSAIILENRRLREAYIQLLESFIEVLARAIDAKSPYTGAHCQRVPVIARLLATAAVSQDTGPLKEFEMSQDDWYSLHIASWLHDCGKVTTPDYVVDKATKLETIYNRIHEIRDRFEILRRDAHIEYLKKRLNNTASQETLQAEFVAKIKNLEEDYEFIARCNIGDTELTDEDIAKLEKLSETTFTRYFSRMKGLSWAERDNIKDQEAYDKPAIEKLLQDRDDHHFKRYNYGELYNLCVKRGTINREEREKINEHIVVTIDMLKALPFPKELVNVVEYAGNHHERIDGKGYPNGLTGSQMSIPAKIMAIADIFEALTASDRPYKEPKKLSEVLRIMKDMKDTGHIDPELFRIFISNEVYQDYADQYMNPQQVDEVNPTDYL